MANPSLQIGNSNWAIKEDNLLGYSTAGTRFLPQPITMTRASAGTRVNAQGLVETVELLGSELVTDGNFPTGTTAWSSSTGWTLGGGVAAWDGASTYIWIAQTIGNYVGKQVKVTFDAVINSGNLSVIVANGGGTPFITTSGSYEFYLSPTGGGAYDSQVRVFQTIANSDFTITNISVKEVTRNNLARVDYDGTASSLLVEPERTNLVTYSEDFSNADWIKSAASVVSGFTSPDGTDNAFKLVEDTSTGIHRISVDGITVVAEKYSVSIYAKSDGRNEIRVSLANYFSSGTDAYFNLDTKVITLGSLAENGLIETLSNGWFRCSFTSKNVAFAGGNAKAYIDTALNGSSSYTGDGTSGVYIYGAQLERGSYPTSYIPTSGTTVTRVADQYSKTGISNLINSEEGVLFLEVAALSESGGNGQIQLRDAASTNVISIQLETGIIKARSKVSNVSIGATLNYTTPIVSSNKIAIMWTSLGVFTFWVNGFLRGTVTHGSTFSSGVLTNVNFDSASTYFFEGKVKQLQVFKTALTDTELATLTT